jgi:O-antigen ligase
MSFAQRVAASSLLGEMDFKHLQRLIFLSIAIILLAGSFFIKRYHKDSDSFLEWNPITVYLFYTLFCITSTIWSKGTIATLGKSIEMLIGCLIVLITMYKKNQLFRLRRMFNWFVLIYSVLTIFAFLGALIYPESYSTGPHRVTAPWFSGNAASYSAVLVSIVFLARSLRKNQNINQKLLYGFLYSLFSFISIYAAGRTAIILWGICSLVVLTLLKPKISLVIIIPVSALITYTYFNVIFEYLLRGQSANEILKLSGRLVLWKLGIVALMNKFLIGYGFGVGSRTLFYQFGTVGYSETISGIHNGFLEVALGTGIIGFCLWISSISWGLFLLFKSLFKKENVEMSILSILLLGSTFAGSGVGGWMDYILGFFFISTAYAIINEKLKTKIYKLSMK